MVTSIEVISGIAIVIGVIWVYINFYTFAPVYRRALFRLLGNAHDPRVITHATVLPESQLPRIDVLLPAYEERETIAHSIRALRAAEYPAKKLMVNVLVEASDTGTRAELAKIRQLYDFRVLVIPPSYPGRKNKPRALNYGFHHTDGDIVGVIDAEDIVAPELFSQVAAALVENDFDYVQGRLDMQNEGDGVLNTLFRGEYGFWYGAVIPSFFQVGYPVPLGGTTNFAHRGVLEAIAEERIARFGMPWTPEEHERLLASGYEEHTPWDPRNVAEDFELGLLLWESEYRMAMIPAVTREESPVTLNGWIRQRTRWQKGKLYTLLQRLKTPPTGVGQRVHVYTQSGVPHLGPLNIIGVVLLAMYAWVIGFLAAPIVAIVLLVGLAFVVQQLVLQAYGYWSVTDTQGLTRLRRTLVNFAGLPLYWLLLWGSDIRALSQLAASQLDWEKTHHTGRHVEDTPVAGVETVLGLAGLQLRVYQTPTGWTWEVLESGTPIAQAGSTYDTEHQATTAAEIFGNWIHLAVNPDLRFSIDHDEHWQWTLVGDTLEATGAESTPDRLEALEAVIETKSAAGTAGIR